ncbi:MAG: hypothetical protein QOF87_1928, partial [Pseudonocardiales bacterium]|nr:hypothetical protein [Pseudonocardiales bacterium]
MDSAADIAIEGVGLFHIFRETTLETV